MTIQRPCDMATKQLRHGLRAVFLCLTVAPLIGCQTSTNLPFAKQESDFSQALSSHQASMRYSEQQSVAPTMAVVRLRDQKAKILSATERRYQNGFSQRIVYPVNGNLAGENWIDVRVVGREKLKNAPKVNLALHSNQLSIIQNEASNTIPNLSFVKQANTYYQNAYGAYGLYVKQLKGNNGCLFGWQTLLKGSNVRAPSKGWPTQQGLSYRVRYCAEGLNLVKAQGVMNRILLAPHFARLWGETVPLTASTKAPLSLSTTYSSPLANRTAAKPKATMARSHPRPNSSHTKVPHPADDNQGTKSATSNIMRQAKPSPLMKRVAPQVPAP